MIRKIGTMYLCFAILMLLGKTMEGRYLLVHLNERIDYDFQGYTYFENHGCKGKFLGWWMENFYESRIECEIRGNCGCFWTNRSETMGGPHALHEGTAMDSDPPHFDGTPGAWVKS